MLTDIWMRASDKPPVNGAALSIDYKLARDPYHAGYEESEGLYRIEVRPLFALYSVDEQRKRVLVEAFGYRP